jgi:hypothetical protein
LESVEIDVFHDSFLLGGSIVFRQGERESFNFLIAVSKLLAQAALMPSERSTVVSLPIKSEIVLYSPKVKLREKVCVSWFVGYACGIPRFMFDYDK